MESENKTESEFREEKIELNIEQILQSDRAWEYLLLDIVKSEELDPWDIDITKLTENYLGKIQKMRELDLRIPARIILAAAILLKMQSEDLVMSKEDEKRFDDMFADEELPAEKPEPVPLLDLRIQRRPSRKITLTDLIKTLQDAMIRTHAGKKEKQPTYNLALPEVDITEQIEELYRKILNVKGNEKIPFSTLIPSRTVEGVIGTFIPMLHLFQEQKIDVEQEKIFGEIYILRTKLSVT